MKIKNTDFKSKTFPLLCDIIASDNLMVVSGAGVSTGIKQRGTGKFLPNWPTLIERLHLEFKSALSKNENREITEILLEKEIPSKTLIEIAARLRQINSKIFDDKLRKQVTPEKNMFSETHKVICDLYPRGILTFNYDDCHENAMKDYGITIDPLLPSDDEEFVKLLKSGIKSQFLLKAHGCINRSDKELVLDSSSYRNVLAKQPAYRAFVQNLLTNFDCLFIGFGLSDPDFDLFVDVIAASYGSPIRTHVAIRHISEKSSDEYYLKSKYGIHILHVSEFNLIPNVLKRATKTAGPILAKIIEQSISSEMKERILAHRKFSSLGQMGRSCASSALVKYLKHEKDEFKISEIAYALGVLDSKSNKKILMDIVSNFTYKTSAPAARALTVLRSATSFN